MLFEIFKEEMYFFYIILRMELDPGVKTTRRWVSVKHKSTPDAEYLPH